MNRTRKSSAYTIASLEKSVRTERKEHYKLQSAWVKGQEEIKSTRADLRVARSTLDAEKQKLDQREQETFSAQYKLIGIQEALTSTQERLKVLEAERDALKTSLKEEEVARIAAEGRIALPAPKRSRGGANGRAGAEEGEVDDDEEDDDIDFFTDDYNLTHGISPLKSPSKHARGTATMLDAAEADDAGSDKENSSAPSRNNFHKKSTSHPNLRLYQDQHYRQQKEPRLLHRHQSGQQQQQQQMNYLRLDSEIANERARREQAEETVEFLKMECQFRCCSCRVAEEMEAKYVYDGSMAEGMEVVKKEAREAMQMDGHDDLDTDMGNVVGESEYRYMVPEGSKVTITSDKSPFKPSGATSGTDSKEDYFSLIPAGEDSRMLDKSGITTDEDISTKQSNINAGPAESAEARTASLCFSPTSGTFRSASAASASSSSVGAGSALTTAAPTADTSFDSDQSNYATPPNNMDRPSNHGRVLPFKPLLDTIPSHPASPYQDRLTVRQGEERPVQNAECDQMGNMGTERDWQRREPTELVPFNNNNNDDDIGNVYKGAERYYTPAEELDVRPVEDTFDINGKSDDNGKDSRILAAQAHEREQEAEAEEDEDEGEEAAAEMKTDSLTNSNNDTTAEPQTPVSMPASRSRFMLRTVTTTTQVPLQSTPVTKTNNNNNISYETSSSNNSNKVMTTPHHHFNHDYNRNQNHPSTTGPRVHDHRRHDHHHHHQQHHHEYHEDHNEHLPPTPMTAPLPPSSSLSSSFVTDADNAPNAAGKSGLTEREHDHTFLTTAANNNRHHHHTPIDRAAALAQIQARRGRARSLAEGLHQQQQQQQQKQQQQGMTPRSGTVVGQNTTTTTTTTSAANGNTNGIGNGNGNGNRIMKRDTRDISAPALKGRGF